MRTTTKYRFLYGYWSVISYTPALYTQPLATCCVYIRGGRYYIAGVQLVTLFVVLLNPLKALNAPLKT